MKKQIKSHFQTWTYQFSTSHLSDRRSHSTPYIFHPESYWRAWRIPRCNYSSSEPTRSYPSDTLGTLDSTVRNFLDCCIQGSWLFRRSTTETCHRRRFSPANWKRKRTKERETSWKDRSLEKIRSMEVARGKRTRWRRFGRGTRASRIPVCLTIVQEACHSPSRTVSWPRTCNRRGGISWTELRRGNSVEIPRKERSFRSDNSIADSRKSSEPEESRPDDATASRKVFRNFRRGWRFLSILFSFFW